VGEAYPAVEAGQGQCGRGGCGVAGRGRSCAGADRGDRPASGWTECLLDTYKALPAVHLPGRVLADLAVVIADGGDALAHLATLRDQVKLFGTVIGGDGVAVCGAGRRGASAPVAGGPRAGAGAGLGGGRRPGAERRVDHRYRERVRWSVYGVADETEVTDVVPRLGKEYRNVDTVEANRGP
jgi:hypothetical protein